MMGWLCAEKERSTTYKVSTGFREPAYCL